MEKMKEDFPKRKMPFFCTLKDLSIEQRSFFLVDSAERPMFLASVKARQLMHHSISEAITKIWNIRLFLCPVNRQQEHCFLLAGRPPHCVVRLSDSNEDKI